MKIAVVGLGIAGLSICARLALAGHDVSGFEQFEPGHANGSSHGDTRIMRLTPGEGEVYVRLARRAQPLWRTWEGLAGRPFIEWTGGLMAGPRGSPFVTACQRMSATPAALLRGDAIHAMTRGYIAMPYEWDVFRQEDCGVIAAEAARAFLARQAPKWGARLHHNVRVAAPISGTLTINGDKHVFDAVIVAAGAWAGRLLPEFSRRLSVKRRVAAWYETPEPKLLPLICIDNEDGVYGMPAPRGRYKIGLHATGGAVDDPDHVREPDEADLAELARHVRLLLPKHDPTPVRVARCLYTVTPDENFLIAQSAAHPRVLLFSACSGHGFKFAPVFGELAEEWLMERPSAELESFGKQKSGGVTRLGAQKS